MKATDKQAKEKQAMDERRKDYRVTGRAQVLVKPVGPERSENDCARGYFMSDELMEFAKAYQDLHNRSTEAMARLRSMDSVLTDVLSLLDQKLDLIEQQFHLSAPDEKARLIDVSLSGSGISFLHRNRFEPGQIMALRLTLLPGNSLVYTLAESVRCDPLETGNFQVGLKFIELGTQESQALRRHIMQAERELLRRDTESEALSN